MIFESESEKNSYFSRRCQSICFCMDARKKIIHYILVRDNEIPQRGQDSQSWWNFNIPHLLVIMNESIHLVLFYSPSLYSFYTHALASIESKWDENQNAHIMSKQYFCGKFWYYFGIFKESSCSLKRNLYVIYCINYCKASIRKVYKFI